MIFVLIFACLYFIISSIERFNKLISNTYLQYLKLKKIAENIKEDYKKTYLIKFEQNKDDQIYFFVNGISVETNLKKTFFGNGIKIGNSYYIDEKIQFVKNDDDFENEDF